MIIEHNYKYTNKKLIELGFASLSFHSLNFDRYFSDEEKAENVAAAKKFGDNSPEWLARCEKTSEKIAKQMESILPLFDNYDIHQLTEEKSTINHYRSDWDLYFYSNRGWNGREYFDYFTLSSNDRRSATANMELLGEILPMLEQVDVQNVRCIVQYEAVENKEAIEKAALSILERLSGKMINYCGTVGKFRKVRNGSGIDSYGFFKKGAKKYFYNVNPAKIVLNNF